MDKKVVCWIFWITKLLATCRVQLGFAQERIRVDAIGRGGVGVGVKSGGANGTLERGHPVPQKDQWGSFVQLLACINTNPPRATCHCNWTEWFGGVRNLGDRNPYLSICLSVCLSFCLSIYLSIYPSIYLSMYGPLKFYISIFKTFQQGKPTFHSLSWLKLVYFLTFKIKLLSPFSFWNWIVI